ncbi:MAG TPA: hypothetical protein VHL09_01065 [Dehalococcoidia bacterium]|nr:hypothetical protein [Dehalococcoidia bacterium]
MIGHALANAAREWRLAAALYVPNLFLGALVALPLLVGAGSVAPLGPWVERLTGGGYPDVILEAIGARSAASAVGAATPPEATALIFGPGLGLILLLPAAFVQWAAYTACSGGLLARLAGDRRGFWTACQAWLWPMARCSLLNGAILVWLGLVGAALLLLIPWSDPTALIVKLLIWLIWLGLVDGLLELIRADIVASADRRVLTAAGRVFARLRQPRFFLGALAVWLLLVAAGLVFQAAQLLTLQAIPALAVAPALLVQQAIHIAGAWLKLLRLAVATELTRAAPA